MDQAGGGTSGRGFLAEADARRDAGDWRGAAAAYAAHLARAPQDWAIWIQYGHCVKEAGDPQGALASYRRAEAGRPLDPDLQVQIGHALKRAGDADGARAAYARALELAPLSEAAWREVAALIAAGAADPAAPGLSLLGDLRVVLDLSDLMSWFGTHRAPSGIQRIQMELAAAALGPDTAAAEVRLAVFRPERGAWRELPREAFRRLAALAKAGGDASDPVWTASRAEAEGLLAVAPDLVLPEGGWLVNPGTSWWLPGYLAALREARMRRGVRHAAMVHDVGPVLLPEHSEPAVSARFARWFAALATEADLLLAISEATRGEIRRLAADCLPGLSVAPVGLLRPDAALAPPPAAATHPRLAELAGEPFILFVSTIESRKDHLFVLNAWLALLRRHGAKVPRLVLVGRAGFGAGPALALLERAPAFEGRVLWLDDVDDAALAALYRGAVFTLYHSRHEGWGLPVTEALAAGKVVVAPAHSGLLESGQGLALHYAPGSEPEFIGLVEKLLFEPGFRAAQEKRIASGLALRSWPSLAEDLFGQLAATPLAAPLAAPPLGRTHLLAESQAVRPSPEMAWAERLRLGSGWHAPEAWGCRTRPGRALLRLPLPDDAPAPLRLHVALRGGASARSVALRANRGLRLTLEVPPGARPVAVLELEAPASLLELAIEADPPPGDAEPETGVGVVAVMACAPEEVAARLTFLERLAFVWPEPG